QLRSRRAAEIPWPGRLPPHRRSSRLSLTSVVRQRAADARADPEARMLKKVLERFREPVSSEAKVRQRVVDVATISLTVAPNALLLVLRPQAPPRAVILAALFSVSATGFPASHLLYAALGADGWYEKKLPKFTSRQQVQTWLPKFVDVIAPRLPGTIDI